MQTVVVWVGIGCFFLCLTMLAVMDVLTKQFGSTGKKALWGLVALIPFIGWLIYLIFGFRKGTRP